MVCPKVVAEICPFEQGTTPNSFRTTAFPTMTADATGRAYLAWSDRGRQENGTCDPFGAGRIMISTSTNGVNWSPPYAAVPSSTGEHQVMPSLAFTAGKLFLAWVDFSEDVSGVFGQFVDEANLFAHTPHPVNPPAKRHTADVRAAMADPSPRPISRRRGAGLEVPDGPDAIDRAGHSRATGSAAMERGQPALGAEGDGALRRRLYRHRHQALLAAGPDGDSPAAQLDAEQRTSSQPRRRS